MPGSTEPRLAAYPRCACARAGTRKRDTTSLHPDPPAHHDDDSHSRRPTSTDIRTGTRPRLREGCTVASKTQDIRPKITLACTDCKGRNYITKKNRRNDPDRLDLKKFCPKCGKHTSHRETR